MQVQSTFRNRETKLRVMLLTEQFAVNLGNCLCWEKPTLPCLRPSSDIFHLNRVSLMCSRALCVWVNILIFLRCSMWLELRIYFALGLFWTKHLTYSDQWKGHVAIEIHVFDRNCMFSSWVVASVKGPMRWKSTAFSSVMDSTCLMTAILQTVKLQWSFWSWGLMSSYSCSGYDVFSKTCHHSTVKVPCA